MPDDSAKDDSVETENSDDLKNETEKRRRQKFIYKFTSKEFLRFPWTWQGCVTTNNITRDVYGLIIRINDKTCYFLTERGDFPYNPKNLDSTKHLIVGCWAKLEIGCNSEKIISVNSCTTPPLHTRVCLNDENPKILIYEHVRIVNQNKLRSSLLGDIENEGVDIEVNSKEVKFCNVEYEISSEITKKGLFMYDVRVLKYHGSTEIHSALPRILSCRPEYDSEYVNITGRYHDYFINAFFDEQEIQEKNARIIAERRRARNDRIARSMPTLRKDTPPDSEITQENESAIKSDSSMASQPDTTKSAAFNSSPSKMSKGVTGSRLFGNVTANSSTAKPSSKKSDIIFMTYSAFGYPLDLAEYYLKRGHKVAIHCVNIDMINPTVRRLQPYIEEERAYIFQDRLDAEGTARVIEHIEKQLGPIDTVFHFASAIRKVGNSKTLYDELIYLFEQNVKPFNYIASILSKRPVKIPTKLIAVAPIVDLNVIQDHLIKNINSFMSHLHMAVDEIADLDDQMLVTRIVNFDEFKNCKIKFGLPTTPDQVCAMLDEIANSLE